MGYRVARAVVCVRGGTPSETQYRSNVVHPSPARLEILPGFGSQRDIVKTRLMVQCDLLCPFPRALCDFPYSVHLKMGLFINIELRYRVFQISRGLSGFTPSGRHMRDRGWALESATVDHGASLPFCKRDYISVFTHPSCEVGTWFGSSMGVTSAPLNWEPSKIPADTGSSNSLRRTLPM